MHAAGENELKTKNVRKPGWRTRVGDICSLAERRRVSCSSRHVHRLELGVPGEFCDKFATKTMNNVDIMALLVTSGLHLAGLESNESKSVTRCMP